MQYQIAVLLSLALILQTSASSSGGGRRLDLPSSGHQYPSENESKLGSRNLFSVRGAQASCGSIEVRDKTPEEQTRLAKKGCDDSSSKGLRSSHNCANAGGKAYFCNPDCYSKAQMKKLNAENGECFI
ncbi:hypothetical protein AB1N83_012946 [Pleurotus pulmonarius]